MEERYNVLTAYPHENLHLTKRQIIDLSNRRGGWWILVEGQRVDATTFENTEFSRDNVVRLAPPLVGSFHPQVKVKTLSKKGEWELSEEYVSDILGEGYFVYIDGAYIPPTTELQEKDLESWQDIRRYRKVREWTD